MAIPVGMPNDCNIAWVILSFLIYTVLVTHLHLYCFCTPSLLMTLFEELIRTAFRFWLVCYKFFLFSNRTLSCTVNFWNTSFEQVFGLPN